jgi:hypothetical protein
MRGMAARARIAGLSAVAAVSLFVVASASASAIYDPKVKGCSGRNCGAVAFGATVNGYLHSAQAWLIQVYAAAGECLRVEVTAQDTDLELRVVSPDASRTWFNDDSGLAPCPLCPLFSRDSVRDDGWYTVQIGEYGGASVQAGFTLAYGRYKAGNPNCPAAQSASRVSKGIASPAPEFVPGR